MQVKSDCFYTKNDEWVLIEGDVATVGLTDYAQDALSDIVFVELTAGLGDTIAAEDQIATVESIKAASDVYAPVAGEVVALNDAVSDSPELINQDPFGAAWLIKLKGSFDTSALMDAAAYEAWCADRH